MTTQKDSPDRDSRIALVIREARPEDMKRIKVDWIRSEEEHGRCRRLPSRGEYRARWWGLIEDLCAVSTIYVAEGQATGAVVGWACVEGVDRVHYVWVAKGLQRLGVARAMLEHAGVDVDGVVWYSHRTHDSEAVLAGRPLWRFSTALLVGVGAWHRAGICGVFDDGGR